MIAVIKGDIIASRKIQNPEKWMNPLKDFLNRWGERPKNWDIVWGDSFQLEIDHPEEALMAAFTIKAIIKSVESSQSGKKTGVGDVRMAIGIGEKTYAASRIFESNGPAFVNAGEKFEALEKSKSNLLIKTPWQDFNDEMNLYFRLLALFIDKWTIASAQLAEIVLSNPEMKQHDIGLKMGIAQNSVSGRWKRANIDELFAVDARYRQKLESKLK